MKLKYLILLPFILFFSIAQSNELNHIIWFGGEVAGERIEPSKITANHNEFEGSYHFGFSEMESNVEIMNKNGTYILRHKSGRFSDNGEKFIWEYKKLENFKVIDGQFEKEKWKGRFVYYYFQPIKSKYYKGEIVSIVYPIVKLKGLIIYNSPADIENELGIRIKSYENYEVAGKYPISHYKFLNQSDIQGKSKYELKIMRNEIFARYGYSFRKGGQMDSYFRKQPWYTPRFNDVTKFMNNIEIKNIQFILSNE